MLIISVKSYEQDRLKDLECDQQW